MSADDEEATEAERVLALMSAIREATKREHDFGVRHGAILGVSADEWLDAGYTPEGWMSACALVIQAAAASGDACC